MYEFSQIILPWATLLYVHVSISRWMRQKGTRP